MTNQETIANLNMISVAFVEPVTKEQMKLIYDTFDNSIKALEQEPCEDAISRQAVLDAIEDDNRNGMWSHFVSDCDAQVFKDVIRQLPSINPQDPKTGHCKDCKWWKDSDGTFRRGIGAESQCPINSIEEYENGYCYEVYEGNGYCYMFEQKERSEKE